jgi:hypothetical protein
MANKEYMKLLEVELAKVRALSSKEGNTNEEFSWGLLAKRCEVGDYGEDGVAIVISASGNSDRREFDEHDPPTEGFVKNAILEALERLQSVTKGKIRELRIAMKRTM